MVQLPLETERLTLRDCGESDWQAIHVYASDPLVARFMPWGPNTEDDTQAYVRRVMEGQKKEPRTEYELVVILKPDGRLIGGCGLRVVSLEYHEGVMGYCFGRDVWGQGYAPEAARALFDLGFEQLGLHRIFADCNVENVASARVMEKVGMSREGLLRENMWYKGRWRDSYRYAILEHEWRG